jgi:hypothetical protein
MNEQNYFISFFLLVQGESKMPLNLQYQNGHLLVFVLRNKNTNEIYGILDNLDSAQNKIFNLSKIGVITNDIKTERYKVTSN